MTVQTGNKLTPDQITLAGSYASPDSFPVSSIVSSGANHIVTLETQFGAMARLGYQSITAPADQRALLLTVFGVGRALRVVDTEGKEQYGTITDVQGGSTPTILLASSSPNLLYRGGPLPKLDMADLADASKREALFGQIMPLCMERPPVTTRNVACIGSISCSQNEAATAP